MVAAFLQLQALIFAGSAALYTHRFSPENSTDLRYEIGSPCIALGVGALLLMAARGFA